MKKYIFLFVVVVFCTISGVSAQSYKIIVNKTNAVETISQKELAMVFLKKKKKWENGTLISPIDQQASAQVRGSFSKQVFKKNVAAIRSYWQRAIFSGMDAGPIEKESDKDVIEYVKNNKGAIGYISDTTQVSGVKVLAVK